MKIALIAPPFIEVPPQRYGGTELFIADLAEGLAEAGHEPVVYAVRSSTVRCPVRGWFDEPEWPPASERAAQFRNHVHTVRAIRDCLDDDFDVVHVHDVAAVPLSVFLPAPVACTLHHDHEPEFSAVYAQFPEVQYVAISQFQQSQETLARIRTIHHGLRTQDYTCVQAKQQYLSFLGRIAPIKGVHVAIEVAKKTGIPLKIAGEIQPVFQDYWEADVKPHLDGRLIEYVGEADLRMKNELLGHSMACLFPITWNEPFGLVMIEAMACGTPVLAFGGGSVPEVVEDGVSGWICENADDMAARAQDPGIDARECRRYVEEQFSVRRMVADYVRLYEQLAEDHRESDSLMSA